MVVPVETGAVGTDAPVVPVVTGAVGVGAAVVPVVTGFVEGEAPVVPVVTGAVGTGAVFVPAGTEPVVGDEAVGVGAVGVGRGVVSEKCFHTSLAEVSPPPTGAFDPSSPYPIGMDDSLVHGAVGYFEEVDGSDLGRGVVGASFGSSGRRVVGASFGSTVGSGLALIAAGVFLVPPFLDEAAFLAGAALLAGADFLAAAFLAGAAFLAAAFLASRLAICAFVSFVRRAFSSARVSVFLLFLAAISQSSPSWFEGL